MYYVASLNHCQSASLLRFGRLLEGCINCQSFADWQEALSVYRPAGKEESKVVIKSAYEVEGMRQFRHDKQRDPSVVVYQMDRDIARGLRQRGKMKGLQQPIFLSISGSDARKIYLQQCFERDGGMHRQIYLIFNWQYLSNVSVFIIMSKKNADVFTCHSLSQFAKSPTSFSHPQ